MHFGVSIFDTDSTIRIDELARAAEALGFESLWVPEHTHIPRAQMSLPGGKALPEEYWRTHDPFVALAVAAAVTTRLRLGTGICLVVQRDPITLAKEVASLDHLSGGRFLFGIGGGWNAVEMAHHGTDFGARWRLLRERVLAMKAIWTQDAPEFHGEFVRFGPILSYPKPVQVPHPPIFLGVNTPGARRLVVEYGDGWLPLAPQVGDLGAGIADLRRRAAEAGRDPDSLTVSVYGARLDEAVVRQYERAGAERVVFRLPAADRETVLRRLDASAALARTFGQA